jgi:predicted Rossmann-fold nucleotide-binding protein
VVRAGEESRFPGLAYVIFPGNTGTEEDLLEVWKMLKQNKKNEPIS